MQTFLKGIPTMKLLKTGIAGLDEFLQGGLAPGAFLLYGPPESGSEIFARQVAYSRALHGHVSYFTVTKTPEFVREEMSMYGWDTSRLEQEGKWKFINVDKPESLSEAITQEMKQRKCVVLDSFSELLLIYKTEEATTLLSTMSNQNREYKELHLVLLTQGMQDSKIEVAAQHFADSVIQFTASWEAEVSSRNLIVKKTKGTIVPARRLPYSLGKNGFTIETATRIT
jgi:KaiC/GvpD/RAD55 family RecA-like ATPase